MSSETPGPHTLSAIEALAERYLEGCRRGESPSAAALLRSDSELRGRADELAPMLEALGNLHRFAASSSGSSGIAELGPPGSPAAAGQQLGDFRLLREIGRGGMGLVFEAEQLSLGRRVAVKVLPLASFLDPRRRDRFLREARAAARLNHPHVVPVFEIAETSGVHYYAMQYIDGAGLDAVLGELRRLSSPGRRATHRDQDALPSSSTTLAARLLGRESATHVPEPGSDVRLPEAYFDQVARIVRDAAGGLHHAHEHGVLHRDIKPSNLLLDTRGEVWVTDFGLAKTLEEESLTRSGELVGTLRYMAPERLERGSSDPRSDVYSLGVTFYELLTLEPAFNAAERSSLLRAVTACDPARPRKVLPSVPRSLEAVALRAMSRDPARRYPTAAGLAEDLERFLARRPVIARPPTAVTSLWKGVRRRPGSVAAAGLSVFALAAVVLLGTVPARHFQPAHVAAADFDGDGRLDVAVAAFNGIEGGGDHVSLLLGRDGGRFVHNGRVPVGDFPYGLAAADFDGDGDQDLAVAHGQTPEVWLLNNDGHGGLSPGQVLKLESVGLAVAARDLDGDSRPELLAIARRTPKVFLYRRGEDGAFTLAEAIESSSFPDSIAFGDVDGDGVLDLVTANAFHKNVTVFLGSPGEGFHFQSRDIDMGYHPLMAVLVDLDDDGAPDIAAPRFGVGGRTLLWNRGGGAFQPPEHHDDGGSIEAIEAADLNGDGRPDLVGAGGDSNVIVWLNEGGRSFAPARFLPGAVKPAFVTAVDLDLDGSRDLVVSCVPTRGYVLILLNDGAGSFPRVESLSLSLPILSFP